VIARHVTELFNETPPDQVNPELFASALIARWKKSYAPISVFNRASALRGFCRWLDKLTATRRFSDCVPAMSQPDPRTLTITQDDVTTLAHAAPPWLRVVILSCYELGLRSGTAMRLCPEHWNREAHTVTIETKKARKTTQPVSPRLEELFESSEAEPGVPFWLAHHGPDRLQETRGAARHKTTNAVMLSRAWNALKKKCGVDQRLWLHDLRRTLCVLTYEQSGKDLIAAQAALGHKNLATTLRYLAPLTRDAAKLRTIRRTIWIPKGGPVQ